jgi:cytochrome P450
MLNRNDDLDNVNGSVAAPAASERLYPPAVTPPEAPLNILAFLREFPRNPLRSVPRTVYENDIFVLRRPFPAVTYAWITAPDLIEEVLIGSAAHLVKSQVEKRVFARSVGNSVLTADGAEWRWQRRVLAPLFRHQEILSYVPRMAQAATEQVARWRAAGPGRRNIDKDTSEATLAVIMRTMLADCDDRLAGRIMSATGSYLSKASWEAAYAILRVPDWFPHPGTWRMSHSSRELRQIMALLIERRRVSGSAHGDLLGRLLEARDPETGERMDDERLIDNLTTLLLAGHETTAKALTWSLYLLARAPSWQGAVRAEVDRVAGEAPIGGEHIEHLAVTSRVLKESMRLYPPAPVVARVNTECLCVRGETLPPGSNIVFPVYAIHRHRRYWEDPDLFDPDRFRPEKEKAIPRTQYMPFGAGPRICIGQSFAMMEATVLLATFIRAAHFTWDGRHKPEPVSRVTLHPSGGMPLEIAPLEQRVR